MKKLIILALIAFCFCGCARRYDINRDGIVDVSDILCVTAYEKGDWNVPLSCVDLNHDGGTDDEDKEMIRQYIIGGGQ